MIDWSAPVVPTNLSQRHRVNSVAWRSQRADKVMVDLVAKSKRAAQLHARSAGTSMILALLLLLIFIADVAVGSPDGLAVRRIDAWLGYSDAGVGAGDAWRIASPNLVHTSEGGPGPLGLSHIFGNTLVLLLYGPYVERLFGRRRFIAIAAIAGIAAFGWLPVLDRSETAVGGSSGIIWGLIAAGAVASGLNVLRSRTGLEDLLILTHSIALLIFVVMELSSDGVLFKHLVHLGAVVGGTAVFWWTSVRPAEGPRLVSAALALWAALAVAGLVV